MVRLARRCYGFLATLTLVTEVAVITHRVLGSGRFRRHSLLTSGTVCPAQSRNGLDLRGSMFAPCLLGCPGTPWQEPVRTGTAAVRHPVQNGTSWHRPVQINE